MGREYVENFANGPGGWWGFGGNHIGPKPLEWQPGRLTSRSPWWIDYNHAPPGAGYLHMLFCLNTSGGQTESIREAGGDQRYIVEKFPTNFTNAQMTLRLRGELVEKGAKLVLLIQSSQRGTTSPWVLTSQPFQVTTESTSQTVSLLPDPHAWTSLGSRHDRTDMYGELPLLDVMGNVNTNIMLALFPLDIQPMGPLEGDKHRLRPERDYPVWRHQLPEGYVTLEEIRIHFA